MCILTFQTLSDEKQRQDYDNFGTTSAQAGQQRDGFPGGGHPFEAFFNQGPFGFSFNFGGRQESGVGKHRLSYR